MKNLASQTVAFSFSIILIAGFTSGCASTSTTINYPPNTVVIVNRTPYFLVVSRNGSPWKDDNHGESCMVPHETLVFNGVATTVREKIIIKITASAECKFGGCIPIASSAGSHTYTIDIGTIEPAKLISVSKWNLWSLF